MVRPAPTLEPSATLEGTLIAWGAGVTVYRVHHERFQPTAFNASRTGNARFSPILDRTGNVIPTLYSGTTLDCALMETIFHDVPYKPGFKPLSLNRLNGRMVSKIRIRQDLQLIDLGTIALRRLGIKRSQLIDTTKAYYPRTRRWAEAFYAQFPKAQGLCWTSRQDDHARAIMLFETRVTTRDLSTESDSSALLDDGEPVLPVLDLAIRLGVTLVD